MVLLFSPHSVLAGPALRFHTRHFAQRRHRHDRLASSMSRRERCSHCLQVQAFFTPPDDPMVKEAFKEPLAFLGGIFAGVFRLDLNEDPLREWVAKTSEAAGIESFEDINDAKEETPEEITIE